MLKERYNGIRVADSFDSVIPLAVNDHGMTLVIVLLSFTTVAV